MPVPQIVVAAAPYAGALAFTAARFAVGAFGLVAGFAVADKAFGFTKQRADSAEALVNAIATKVDLTTAATPPSAPSSEQDPLPAH